MQNLGSIFLGCTIPEARAYTGWIFKKWLAEGKTTVGIPAVGQFTIAKCASAAGFSMSEVFASDISLYSSALGYYFSGKPLTSLPICDDARAELDELQDESARLAQILFEIKKCQFNPEKSYDSVILDELIRNETTYLAQLKDRVETLLPTYEGINYEIADLRAETLIDRDITFVNPPAYSNGYTKMFEIGEARFGYQSGIPEFDFKKEYLDLWTQVKSFDRPVIMVCHLLEDIDPEHIVLSVERNRKGRLESYAINNPTFVEKYQQKTILVQKQPEDLRPIKAPIVKPDYRITPESQISFMMVAKEEALYYRDLFAHKLGVTRAECYMLMLLDGAVFATVGFHCQKVRSLQESEIFEVYGFNASLTHHLKANRLLMLAITCTEFNEQTVKGHILKGVNRIFTCDGLKTACLAKYRKVKLNNGILKVTAREKMANGLYKIMYKTKWHERTLKECITQYLEDSNE